MDFGLSHEQDMVVQAVRNFVENELYPHEASVERDNKVDPELGAAIRRKVRDLGFYAANMPEEIGGGGLDRLTFALLERELGRASMALTVHFGRPSNILLACNEEQRQRYLLPAVHGEKIDALAITEPDAGSDARGMRTFARRDGSDFVITGTKHFISHADVADFIILFAVTGVDEDPRGTRKKVTGFLVDRDTPGLVIAPGYQSVSHRGYHNSTLQLEDCRVAASQVLGDVDKGWDVMGTWLQDTRLTVAAMCVGRARRTFDLALDWAATRRQFGQPIGRFQGTGFKLADMITEIDAANWLTLSAAWKSVRGEGSGREIASAKLYATEMLGRVTDQAIQIYGGMGLMSDLPLERFWRDARVERIWDGTSEIQRHIISRTLLRERGA